VIGRGATQPLVTSLLRAAAFASLIVYVAWNAFWLAQGEVPPALFLGLTGLPAPTTGGTRSLHALALGHWSESFRWNAMTLPLCGLLTLTGAWLTRQALQRQRLSLPRWMAWSWFLVLSVAWVLKLADWPH
jgi:hypothetical protein